MVKPLRFEEEVFRNTGKNLINWNVEPGLDQETEKKRKKKVRGSRSNLGVRGKKKRMPKNYPVW